MKRITLAATALVLGLLPMTGCVTTGSSSNNNNLSQTVSRHEQQIQSILSQMGQVETVIPGQAEMWAQLQSMRQELNQAHARMEDGQGGGSGSLARLEERVNRMEALVRTMASQLAISTAPLDAPSSVQAGSAAYGGTQQPRPQYGATGGVIITNNNTDEDAAGAAGPPTASSGGQDLYDAGMKAFEQRKYKEAVVAFKDFAAQNPKHNLTSNAFFWQGESYFQLQDYARAALAYQEVIAKYAGSSKFQAAMLKQGISLFNANKKDAAKERLEALIKRYPNSQEATRAKSFMKEKKLG